MLKAHWRIFFSSCLAAALWWVGIEDTHSAQTTSVVRAEDGESGAYLEGEEILKWGKSWQDDPRWLSGWPHDFVDPSTGRYLPWGPVAPLHREGEQSSLFSAWVAIGRHKDLSHLSLASSTLLKSRSPSLAVWMATRLNHYRRIVEASGQRLALRPQVGGLIFRESYEDALALPSLIMALEALRQYGRDDMSDQQMRELVEPIVERAITEQKVLSNKSVWRAVAIDLACRVSNVSAACAYSANGEQSLRRVLVSGISPDGYWIEQTPHYQDYVAGALLQWLDVYALLSEQKKLANEGAYGDIKTAFTQLTCGLVGMRYPNGDVPFINDVPGRGPYPSDLVYMGLRRHFSMERRETEPAVLSNICKTSGLKEGVSHLRGMGITALRSAKYTVTAKTAQRTLLHAHQDILGIEAAIGKKWVLRNPGSGSYASRLYAPYFKLAYSHSVPLVDGRGIRNWFKEPSLVEGLNSITMSVSRFDFGVDVSRTVSISSDSISDKTAFVVTDGRDHLVGTIYHTPCVASILNAESRSLPNAPPYFPFPSHVRDALNGIGHYAAGSSAAIELLCEGEVFRMTVESDSSFTIGLGASPSPYGESLSATRRSILLFKSVKDSGFLGVRIN